MSRLLLPRGNIGAKPIRHELIEKATKVDQRGHGDTRGAELHRRTGGAVEHPGRDDGSRAVGHLADGDRHVVAHLAVVERQPLTEGRVPPVEDLA
jgi:hypothetical protein